MKVLLATDGSPDSLAAAVFVGELAHTIPVDLTLVTISFEPKESSIQPWIPEWSAKEKELAQKTLKATADQVGDACHSLVMLHESGDFVPKILKLARTLNADLIVLGAKGHSMLHRLLLGSVSDSVATHANCSVLVVRTSKTKDKPTKNVAIGYDDSIPSKQAVAEFMKQQWPIETQVNLISVAQLPFHNVSQMYDFVVPKLDDKQIEHVKLAADRALSQITTRHPNTKAIVEQAFHIGEALVKIAEENSADLLIVGDHGHGMLDELLLGSTTKYVLRHAHTSVWISRSRPDQTVK